MSTPKPANAGAITRTLVAAGFRKAEYHASGMVRGYGTWSPGVKSEAIVEHGRRRVQQGTYRDGSPRFGWQQNNTPTGKVAVDYVLSRSWDSKPAEERRAEEREQLAKAAEILQAKGYRTVEEERGSSRRVLVVWREDADGNVVVF